MDPSKETLEEILRLTRENNEYLHGMRNRERVANIFRVMYWLLIIGSIFGAYYFVQPYIDSTKEALDSMQEQVSHTQDVIGKATKTTKDTARSIETVQANIQALPEAQTLQGLLNLLLGKQ